jgi:hypothetical protein
VGTDGEILMARKPLMMMRKKGLLGNMFAKHANHTLTLSKSVGAFIELSSGTTNIVLPSTNRAPAWESTYYTPLSKNAAGFTDEFSPNADSRIMYVTASGNDATALSNNDGVYSLSSLPGGTWDAPSGHLSFATISAASALIRANQADYILVKRGDTIVETVQASSLPVGLSVTERHVIASYGSLSLARPIVDLQFTPAFGTSYPMYGSTDGNIAFMGIEYTSTFRDPDHVNFVTWYDYPTIQLFFNYSGDKDIEGILIEDNKATFVSTPMAFNIASSYFYRNIVVRRNEFANIWWGFSIGIVIGSVTILSEENIFKRVGYFDKYEGAQIENPSNGHFIGTTSGSNLTGATETTVTLSKALPANMPTPVRCRFNAGTSSEIDVKVTSFTGSTITFDSQDFTSDATNSGSDFEIFLAGAVIYNHSMYLTQMTRSIVRNNYSDDPSSIFLKNIGAQDETLNSNNAIYDNFCFGGEIGISSSGNAPDSTVTAKFSDYEIHDNTFIDVNENNNTNRDAVAYGIETRDHKDTNVSQNRIIRKGAAIASNFWPFRLAGLLDNVNYNNNISFEIGDTAFDLLNSSQTYSVTGVLNTDLSSAFRDGSATIDAFLTSIGETGSSDAFYNLIKDRRQGDWNTLDRQLKSYIDLAFTPENGAYFIQQPQDASYYAAATAIMNADAYGTIGATYQWYDASDDSEISGEVASTFERTMTAGLDGFSAYRKVTSTWGEIQSNSATWTLDTSVYLELGGVDEDLTVTAFALNTGEWIEFDFETNDSNCYMAVGTGPVWNPAIRVSSGGGQTTLSFANGTATIDGTAITTGSDFTPYMNSGIYTLRFTASRNSVIFDTFGSNSSSNNFMAGRLSNIKVNKAAGQTIWGVDSRSTTTEAPSTDANSLGNITMNNIVSGDWKP